MEYKVRKVLRELLVIKVLKVELAHKGLLVLKDQLVLRVQSVLKDLKGHKV